MRPAGLDGSAGATAIQNAGFRAAFTATARAVSSNSSAESNSPAETRAVLNGVTGRDAVGGEAVVAPPEPTEVGAPAVLFVEHGEHELKAVEGVVVRLVGVEEGTHNGTHNLMQVVRCRSKPPTFELGEEIRRTAADRPRRQRPHQQQFLGASHCADLRSKDIEKRAQIFRCDAGQAYGEDGQQRG